MKNLHIIPTEKPSRIGLHTTGIYNLACELYENSPNFSNRNIYITSDEKPKKGDWVLNLKSNGVYPIFFLNEVVGYEKKIILTTDQDLIKDGVQSIDDTFLEWFVKNPTCEFVKTEDANELLRAVAGGVKFYKIIIPQEETTPVWKQIIESCGGEEEFMESAGLKPKKETLEEASHTAWLNYEHVEGNLYSTSFKNGFKFGAKWQAERMYSEEDVMNALHSVELKNNKDYSKIYEGIKEFLNNLKK
jgi:hypothetical protein